MQAPARRPSFTRCRTSLHPLVLALAAAFAAQALACSKELKLDMSKVNVNGGAIALGHPIGASGSRILVTLIHELIKQNKELGLCSLCIGGGQGISLIISNAQTN